jgi:hypothetical protein
LIFGVRDVVDVTLKDRTTKKPEIYLSNLKMSSFDIGADIVYARGGRGNPKLITWDGNKDIKFTCEDCLISPTSLSILTGGTKSTGVRYVSVVEVLEVAVTSSTPTLTLGETIYDSDLTTYPLHIFNTTDESSPGTEQTLGNHAIANQYSRSGQSVYLNEAWVAGDKFLVSYYKATGATNQRVIVKSDTFPETFEISGYTLWRDEDTGSDYVCRIRIPKAKLVSTFTITQQPDGDPSTFKFEFEVMKASVSDTSMVYFDIDETAAES